MNFTSLKMIKYFFIFSSFCFLFSGCAQYKNLDDSKSFNFISKRVVGSNNFAALIDTLVSKSDNKLKKYLMKDDAVLVSDFVNLDNLKNHSKLGFLLSDQLKNSLLKRDIIVKQIELDRNFEFGESGFNVLTREYNNIKSKDLDNQYALVGTYSLTTKNLIVFLKLIELKSGNILSSASVRTSVDEEILDLDKSTKPFIIAPMVL